VTAFLTHRHFWESPCTNECWACLHSAQQAPKTPTPVAHIQQHRLFDGHYEQLIHLQVIGKEQTKQYTTQHQNTTEHMLEIGSRVVSVLDSGTERPGFKLQPRRCRVTVLDKPFAPIVPLFTKQQNRRVYDSPPLQADCQAPGSAPEPYAWQSSMGYLYIFLHMLEQSHIQRVLVGRPQLRTGRSKVLLQHEPVASN